MKTIKIILAVCSIFLIKSTLFSDVLHLINEKKLNGKIIQETERHVEFKIGDQNPFIIIPKNKIKKIIYDKNKKNVNFSNEKETKNSSKKAIGLTSLKELGFGGLFRYRNDPISMDISLSLMMITVNMYGTNRYKFPIHFTAGAIYFFDEITDLFQKGIRCAAIFDQAYGPGVQGGMVLEWNFSNFGISTGFGVQYYPIPEEYIGKYLNAIVYGVKTEDRIQPYVGLNFIYYL